MERFKKLCLSKERGKAEIAAFIIYIAGLIVISAFHEPWFPETQAWLIAKQLSPHDILFQIGHYESHPPLWYLVLAPFAKSGAPFEHGRCQINRCIYLQFMRKVV